MTEYGKGELPGMWDESDFTYGQTDAAEEEVAARRLLYAIFGVERIYDSDQYDQEILDMRALADWEAEGGAL